MALTLERLRRDGQRFLEELSREYHLAGAGLKPNAELQPIYQRHAEVVSPEALELTLDAFRSAPDGSEERRSARLLLDWQADSQTGRELAPLEEREIAWEAQATLRLDDGRSMQYQRAPIEMANARDRAERLRIERARQALVGSELAPLRRDRFARERDLAESLGLADGYVATWELLSGVELAPLVAQCEQFLRDTDAMWNEVLPAALTRTLGITIAEATRADALALFRGHQFDAHFAAAEMEPQIARQVREMGIDPRANGRIVYDTAEREGKRSRAFCSPVRVPDEVYLVLRPHGGQSDWTTFLHELGHALHFAYMRPELPMEYRWLGDNSITEAYAMLFDHLVQTPGWLARYTQLGRTRLPDFLRAAGLVELHYLRRYSAKLIYETQLYGGTVGWDSLPALYAERLTEATRFRYAESDAFVDVDPRFYSARYLRAWQLQALISETLVERYDEDWWRNPRAGPWLCQALFGEGQRELAHEQAERVAGKGLSFAPLVRAVERMLG